MIRFRPLRVAIAAAAFSLSLAGAPAADDLRFFQLGTGPTGETRFPIGGLIANALSNPPGSRGCERGGSCGVPGLVAVAKSTDGSMANVEAIRTLRLDAALVHADVAFWAQHGIGPYKGKAVPNLRGIAMIYSESLHLVASAKSAIRTVAGLKGKRVSFGETDSATDMHGRAMLGAYGLRERQVRIVPMKPSAAAAALAEGSLDAFLALDGQPLGVVAELARGTPITLVPIDGAGAERLRDRNPFLGAGIIAANQYDNVTSAVPTLDVGVVLVTPAEEDTALVFAVTRALWHPSTQKLLLQGNPRGRLIQLGTDALGRMGIPLHPGAAAYYAQAAAP